ncbi:hypothetical protein Tco_1444367 [Tanacetum coccineum]
MDDPNITIKEYIRLEEEKARKCGEVFNWETAKYGRIWYDEDVHDLRSVETEFPAIIFNDSLTSNETLSCEPTVSSLNDNEIDFRISFDESYDEDYTVVYDKNSFSYKIISVNNLKTDSENDNEKVNMPLFPSPELEVSYFNDLDFFKDFENEFPVIVYNDALTSKSDLLTEPTISPRHIDEFDLKDETSLSKCDEIPHFTVHGPLWCSLHLLHNRRVPTYSFLSPVLECTPCWCSASCFVVVVGYHLAFSYFLSDDQKKYRFSYPSLWLPFQLPLALF